MSSLLKRTFEALYSRSLDFDNVAKQVLWLERRGLDGTSALVAAVPTLNTSDSPVLSFAGSNHCQIEVFGASLFELSGAIMDIAIAEALTTGSVDIRVMNCRDAIAILPGIARCGTRGLYAVARWQEEATGPMQVASVEPLISEPAFQVLEGNAAERLPAGCVRLVCGDQPVALPGTVVQRSIRPSDFAERLKTCVQQGITMSDANYDALCEIADRVLVEDSEASRRGAGA